MGGRGGGGGISKESRICDKNWIDRKIKHRIAPKDLSMIAVNDISKRRLEHIDGQTTPICIWIKMPRSSNDVRMDN